MSSIYGWKDKTLRKYNNADIQCKNCGTTSLQFVVYQKYFYVFFVPQFPFSRKKVRCQCRECNDTSNTEKMEYYLSKTPTNYFSSRVLIILCGIIWGWCSSILNKYSSTNYLNDPQVGDVYVMTTTEYADRETIHFMKVVDMEKDTLFVIQNGLYYYDKDTDEMDDEDYFIDGSILYILKEDLPELNENNTIRKVIREYSQTSNFNR